MLQIWRKSCPNLVKNQSSPPIFLSRQHFFLFFLSHHQPSPLQPPAPLPSHKYLFHARWARVPSPSPFSLLLLLFCPHVHCSCMNSGCELLFMPCSCVASGRTSSVPTQMVRPSPTHFLKKEKKDSLGRSRPNPFFRADFSLTHLG
jgi:hypothetical protein